MDVTFNRDMLTEKTFMVVKKARNMKPLVGINASSF